MVFSGWSWCMCVCVCVSKIGKLAAFEQILAIMSCLLKGCGLVSYVDQNFIIIYGLVVHLYTNCLKDTSIMIQLIPQGMRNWNL